MQELQSEGVFKTMKLKIKPEQVYIVVFCFFAVGAGCKAAGEFAFEKLSCAGASEAPVVETIGPSSIPEAL